MREVFTDGRLFTSWSRVRSLKEPRNRPGEHSKPRFRLIGSRPQVPLIQPCRSPPSVGGEHAKWGGVKCPSFSSIWIERVKQTLRPPGQAHAGDCISNSSIGLKSYSKKFKLNWLATHFVGQDHGWRVLSGGGTETLWDHSKIREGIQCIDGK